MLLAPEIVSALVQADNALISAQDRCEAEDYTDVDTLDALDDILQARRLLQPLIGH